MAAFSLDQGNSWMAKVIIQIPCYNEEEALPITLRALPRSLPGIDKVEWLVINDGSTDRTAAVASACGVDHIVNLPRNQGLAAAFRSGLDACISAHADIIVNTDADNQYDAADIPKLIAPILAGKADIVVGARPIGHIAHFSPTKRLLQRLGSWVVRVASKTDIQDAPSGFRAISCDAAMRLNVYHSYSYTLETILQAGHKDMAIVSVPIAVNSGELRPSRLQSSAHAYIYCSLITIIRIFVTYSPMWSFMVVGAIPFFIGLLLDARWIALYLSEQDMVRTHVPSLILAAVLTIVGVQIWLFAFIADMIAVNRKVLEEIQYRLRRNQRHVIHDRVDAKERSAE